MRHRRTRSAGGRAAALTAALMLPLAVGRGRVAAQDVPPPTVTAVLPTAQPLGISPRGAFLRAVAIPGWGHVAIGSPTRGGFYFGVEAATAYTLIRTRRRLGEARERVAFREGFLRERAAADGVTDPTEIASLLDEDARLNELESLRDSRGDQQEDMVALGIFLLFLSGADAYVSAHLSRFPAPLDLEAQPSGRNGMEVSLRVALPH